MLSNKKILGASICMDLYSVGLSTARDNKLV